MATRELALPFTTALLVPICSAVDKFRSNWLEVFESYLQQELFPRES